jgi:hypothetical protein
MKILLPVILFIFALGVSSAAAQSKTVSENSTEATLIAKEKQKWNALKNGGWLALKEMFAEEFISIGYEPDGSVRATTKAQSFSQENRLPPGVDFVMSDFRVIWADKKNAVVTYQAAGPIKVQATSHWTKRGKNWQTVFYQATMIR